MLALWSGLGYYSRARNLRRAARQIAAAGRLSAASTRPSARCPASATTPPRPSPASPFELPHAVLDGNVLRVVARVENDAADIAAAAHARALPRRGAVVARPAQPGAFNQALMELGATVCLPRNPLCLVCPAGRPVPGARRKAPPANCR